MERHAHCVDRVPNADAADLHRLVPLGEALERPVVSTNEDLQVAVRQPEYRRDPAGVAGAPTLTAIASRATTL